jgi:integrase
MKVATLFESYAASCGLAVKTIQSYRTAVGVFTKLFGNIDVAQITTEHAEGYIARSAGLSDSTINGRISAWKSFCDWLIDKGHIDRSPFKSVKIRKIEYKVPEVFSSDEVRRLLAATRNLFMRAAILLGYYCGFRIEDVRNLCWDDIDWERKEVHIRRKKHSTNKWVWAPKNDSTGFVPLTEEVEQGLLDLYNFLPPSTPNPYVCLSHKHWELAIKARDEGRLGVTIEPWGGFHEQFRRLQDRARVKRKRFHSLRKTCGTDLAGGGAQPQNIATVLRHKNMKTTLTYYIRPDMKKIAEINNRRDKVLS